jgi:hypothetical protein
MQFLSVETEKSLTQEIKKPINRVFSCYSTVYTKWFWRRCLTRRIMLPLSKGPNRVDAFPLTWRWTHSFRNVAFYNIYNTEGRTNKNPVIMSIIHRPQNPLGYKNVFGSAVTWHRKGRAYIWKVCEFGSHSLSTVTYWIRTVKTRLLKRKLFKERALED